MKCLVDSMVIEYEDLGEGPSILLLHGWGNDLHSFDKLAESLQSLYRVVRLDLPGFGGSTRPERWNLDSYVNFVKSFLQKIDCEPSVLIGHSFGGRIIIKGVASGKLLADKLIMIAPAGVSVVRSRRKFFQMLAKVGGLLSLIPPFLFWRTKIKHWFYKAIDSDYHSAGSMKDIFGSVTGEDLSASASKLKNPTLLVWGREDVVTPLADGELLHRLIADSQLEIIENAGHFAHLEKPEEVEKVIMNFIK